MYVYLNHIVIRHHHNGITDRFQICLEVQFMFDIEIPAKQDNEFCTITVFDFHIAAILGGGFRLCLFPGCADTEINFLAKKCIICTF